jgi:L-amino acid N-acyltransferase YncA
MNIIDLQPNHYPEVVRIHLEGIATGNATFQTEAPSWQNWNDSHLAHSRLAAFVDDQMAGWAALSPVSSRCVYAGVAEVSIYVGAAFRGQGVGKLLLQKLIAESEKNELWTLQSGVFAENTSSIRLHESCGFRQIGYRERIGQLNGNWRDNIILERRSKTVGI